MTSKLPYTIVHKNRFQIHIKYTKVVNNIPSIKESTADKQKVM